MFGHMGISHTGTAMAVQQQSAQLMDCRMQVIGWRARGLGLRAWIRAQGLGS